MWRLEQVEMMQILLIAVSLVLAGALPAETALLRAEIGGFEISEEEFRAAYWTRDKEHVALDDQVACRGCRSLRLSNPDAGTYDASITIALSATEEPRIFEVAAAVKAREIAAGNLQWLSARCYVCTFDKSDKPMGFLDIGDFMSGTFDWRRIGRLITIPAGAHDLKITVSLNGCRGTVWFDEITVIDRTSDWKKPERKDVTVRVDTRRSVGMLEQGIGWNWETVSPERYSERETAVWDSLFARMDWDGTDWIRIGVSHAFYAPSNYEAGKDTGQEYQYQVDNRYTRQLGRLLEHCQKRGIPVLLCNWCADGSYADIPNSQWLCTGCFWYPTRRNDPDWKLPYSDERFVEGYCALIKYLIADRGFTCVKWVSIWNEPDGTWFLPGFKERFFRVYELLDARLKKLGLRDKVKILGPESVEGGSSSSGVADDVLRMGRKIEVAATHDYGCGLPAPTEVTSEFKNQHFADALGKAARSLRKSRRAMPLALTEIGSFGTDVYADSRMRYLCTLGLADYIVRCVNAGVAGFLRWQYNDPGDSQFEPFRLSGRLAVPNEEAYWGYAALTRWTVPASDVLRTTISGGKDGLGIQTLAAAGLRSPSGFITIILVNSGRLARDVSLRFAAPVGGHWRHYWYDTGLPRSVQESTVRPCEGGNIGMELRPESVNVVTNYRIGLTGDAPR